MAFNPKHWSHNITDGRDRAPARSMLKGIGFTDEDLARPARWCRSHLDRDHAL